jgi:hypothetical protein
MSAVLSYLWAQARRQPLDTLRFAAGEAWRRGRMRWVDSLHKNLPKFPDGFAGGVRLAAFLPVVTLSKEELRDLPFAASTIERAQQICRHEFEVFGEKATLGPEIDWHRDWKTGYRWPLERTSRLSVLESQAGAPRGTDIKRPWELARFHHALVLGQAFALTGDTAFAHEFTIQARDWMRSNPYPLGAHWAMPMEAAIRAVNLITAAAFFAQGGDFDRAFESELLESLFLHGRHLSAHREWNPVARANHYLASIVGLLYLGKLFAHTQEGRDWFALARREILAEMSNLVGEDGVAREGSSGYHALVAEMFLSSALLLARTGGEPLCGVSAIRKAIEKNCGVEFSAKLRRMCDFLSALCAGRELPPVWGDSDDGRLLPFGDGRQGGVLPLAHSGSALFGPEHVRGGAAADAEVFWRLGVLPQEKSTKGVIPASASFPAAGFFFFSSRRLQGSIRCGPLGARGWSNHAHGDQLSLEFCCDGRPVLVDPGMPCYAEDPAARNLFRSTRYHNGVVIAGAEQNRFWPQLLFRIVDDTQSRVLAWDASPAGVSFSGEHIGYERLDVPARVGRELRLDAKRDVLTVFDNISLGGQAPIEWFFHFAAGIQPERLDEIAAAPPTNPRDGVALAWDSAWRLGPVVMRVWTSLDPQALEIRQEEGWMATRFGQKVAARILSFSGNARGSVAATFEFAARDECALAREASA